MIDVLKGKVAVVTGGAGGIGRATAKTLAEWGAEVIPTTDYNIEGIDATVDMIKAAGGKAYAVRMDVMSRESIEIAFKKIVECSGKIDILVNCAGMIDHADIPDVTIERWNKVIDINLRGTHLCSQLVLPHMIENHAGAIVNVSSQAGQVGGWQEGINYTASKGGILALTKGYARYCAQYGIRVNDVAPGIIESEMTEGRQENLEEVALKRSGTPEEVANAICFLASDLASFITGTTIDINGGQFMHP